MCDISEDLELATDYYREQMPENVKTLAGLASYDLWHGPVYVKNGEIDCDGEPFDFVAACRVIGEWADEIDDVSIEVDYDDETGESCYETVYGTADQIKKALFGKLAEYI